MNSLKQKLFVMDFGVSKRRKKKTRRPTESTSDIVEQEPILEEIVDHEKPQELKLPLVDLLFLKETEDDEGKLVLNSSDQLVYYNSKRTWKPLTSFKPELSKVSLVDGQGNAIVASNSGVEKGGDVIVSTGYGKEMNGEIHFAIGNERVAIINDAADLRLLKGSIAFEAKGGIKARVASGDSEVNGYWGVISIDIPEDAVFPFKKTIKNKYVKNGSLIFLTVIDEIAKGGIPYVWLENIKEGEMTISVHCLQGTLTKICVQFEMIQRE